MNYLKTPIEGVYIIEPHRFADPRGYFMETMKLAEFRENVAPGIEFVQANESVSSRGVLRGLHFQRGEFSQAKLVRVSQGKVVDVAVDIRPGSPTFGQHVAVELSADNARQLFIPRHFAHGFIVLSERAQFQYMVDNVYAPQAEATLRFDDPALGIEWPLPESELLLSAKDMQGMTLDQLKAELGM